MFVVQRPTTSRPRIVQGVSDHRGEADLVIGRDGNMPWASAFWLLSPSVSVPMISSEEFPKLTYLLKAYFFQGWEDMSADPMVDALREEPLENVRVIRDEIDRFVERKFTKEECDRYVYDLFLGAIDDDLIGFLEELRGRLDDGLRSKA